LQTLAASTHTLIVTRKVLGAYAKPSRGAGGRQSHLVREHKDGWNISPLHAALAREIQRRPAEGKTWNHMQRTAKAETERNEQGLGPRSMPNLNCLRYPCCKSIQSKPKKTYAPLINDNNPLPSKNPPINQACNLYRSVWVGAAAGFPASPTPPVGNTTFGSTTLGSTVVESTVVESTVVESSPG
jgi:hypothetical protein